MVLPLHPKLLTKPIQTVCTTHLCIPEPVLQSAVTAVLGRPARRILLTKYKYAGSFAQSSELWQDLHIS